MSTPSGDSVRAEIIENALKVGNPVKDSIGIPILTANALSVDSNGSMAATSPLPVTVSSSQATTTALMSFTGASTLSATGPLTNTIVATAAVTTFTVTGYARVALTDNAGNVTSSNYYVAFGTVA